MGPRSFERGYVRDFCHRVHVHRGSMGPRSFERGYAADNTTWCMRSKLQWGRARLSADISPTSVFPGQTSTASMGPRSFERGYGFGGFLGAGPLLRFNGAALV